MITREEYIDTQRRLLEIAAEVAELPVEDFFEAAQLIDGLGLAGPHTAFVKRVAEAALMFKRSYPVGPTSVLADLEAQRRDAIDEAMRPPAVAVERRGKPAFSS